MNIVSKFSMISALSICCLLPAYGQDDESRAASGLPSMIGRRGCTTSIAGADANVSGSLTVQGAQGGDKQPVFTVAVLANGTLVSRQRIKNKESFGFTCVPRHGVTLIVEVDGLEIGSFPLGTLSPPPMNNRQDVVMTWAQLGEATERRNEVISIRNSYERTPENQKLFDRAVAAAKEKKGGSGVKLYSELLAKDPGDYVAWTELGNIHFANEKYADAEKAYDKALELKGDFLPALTNGGKVYLADKKLDRSVELLTKALAASPDSADVNHYLGEAHLQNKKGSLAVNYLNRALELEPVQKADIHLRLAALYNAAGLKDRAVLEYIAFLQKVPDHPEKKAFEKYISENSPK